MKLELAMLLAGIALSIVNARSIHSGPIGVLTLLLAVVPLILQHYRIRRKRQAYLDAFNEEPAKWERGL